MHSQPTPKIVGLIDENLNCVYAAIERAETTFVHYLEVPKSDEIPTGVYTFIEISKLGYSMYPVTLTSPITGILTGKSINKRSLDPSVYKDQKSDYWALNWFKADYRRLVLLSKFNKKDIAEFFIMDKKKEEYAQPTTRFAHKTTPVKLLATHICYAHYCDNEESSAKYSIDDLIDIYVERFDLVARHGRNVKALTKAHMSEFIVNGKIVTKTKVSTVGVDTFLVV